MYHTMLCGHLSSLNGHPQTIFDWSYELFVGHK
jgi:hypothetical protein